MLRLAAAGVQSMIDAAAKGATITAADIDFACGNCAGSFDRGGIGLLGARAAYYFCNQPPIAFVTK